MKTWNVKEKNTVRNIVCKKPRGRGELILKGYKNVLLLPGKSCLDVKEMIKNGSIDANTSILAVEKDPEICNKIGKYLTSQVKSKKIKNFKIFSDELHRLPLQPGDNIDFVYLDTCGQLNAKIISWLATVSQLPGVFSPNAKIYLAFSQYYRTGSKLLEDYKVFSDCKDTELVDVNPKLIGIDTDSSKEQHTYMATILNGILGRPNKSWIYKNKGNHPAMHVFEYTPREGHTGLGSVFEFLYTYTHEEAVAIAPGIKAYLKRHSSKWEKKAEGEKEEESRRLTIEQAMGYLWNKHIPEMMERIKVLETENAVLKLKMIAQLSEFNEKLSHLDTPEAKDLKSLGDVLKESKPSEVISKKTEELPLVLGVEFPKDPEVKTKFLKRLGGGKNQVKIREYLAVKGPTTVGEIIKDTGINFQRTTEALRALERNNKVSLQGYGKAKVVTLI